MPVSRESFYKGTFILTAAGVVVKIIGSLNWIFISRILGGEGIGLYQMAFPIYLMALSISSAGIPVAISIITAPMDLIKELTKSQLKEIPAVNVGDTVKVHVKVKEGARERIQIFEGTVIAKKHGGIEETFTVRRLSYGVGVEKVFPMHSPTIEKIEVVRHGIVRRAKLYYLRDRVGKAAKIREKL